MLMWLLLETCGSWWLDLTNLRWIWMSQRPHVRSTQSPMRIQGMALSNTSLTCSYDYYPDLAVPAWLELVVDVPKTSCPVNSATVEGLGNSLNLVLLNDLQWLLHGPPSFCWPCLVDLVWFSCSKNLKKIIKSFF